ncbi:DUF1445 domain-containing protein [Xylophilus rhododendri]|uniref:DUF1445 domain-containing protein n=1 Tax=Xylophilus rhododendri TaxID=2697032 RepID=A0A857J185_9BURK|nr:DUF1445 domain-containing protein [Xylophilus rhododendri]QHI97640.1 DUF1445 domain-containing protein [Xylophilus rhododendri]
MTAMPDFDTQSPAAVRAAIRSGAWRGYTNALARGHVQGNLMIVPAAYADDFAEYCRLNPQALPLIGRGEPGSPRIRAIAADLDLRTDVGGYMVFRDGELVDTPRDIAGEWREDLVAFVLGCSFSFEAVLQAHGVRLRHLDEGNVSAMYVTAVQTKPAGPFGGPLVVSMRALRAADAIRAITVSQHFPQFHGQPIHLGAPGLIGIEDLSQSYGGHGLTQLHEDELPVFWACGATAQMAALQARLPLCITHHKAHMVVTDLPVDDRLPA